MGMHKKIERCEPLAVNSLVGPRASGTRIRMYAGPVSWVSIYNHWL